VKINKVQNQKQLNAIYEGVDKILQLLGKVVDDESQMNDNVNCYRDFTAKHALL
jgi:hypothetical protein